MSRRCVPVSILCFLGCLFPLSCLTLAEQTVPERFSEAPDLAALVATGALPPVEERLPEEPLVVVPSEEIGQYGGAWLRMMKGTSDCHAYSSGVSEQTLR